MGFIEPDIVLAIFLIIYLLIGINLFVFGDDTLHHLTPLSYWTASVSITVPLPAANQLSHSKICIQPLLPINNGSPK